MQKILCSHLRAFGSTAEPAILISQHQSELTALYRPRRIFLRLPHFLVDKLYCPTCCHRVLRPRRIVDMHDCFYLIAWGYTVARDASRTLQAGGHAILESMPPYLQPRFPSTTLSYRSGLSHNVMAQLRVDKMGPSGVRSLLIECMPSISTGCISNISRLICASRDENYNFDDKSFKFHTLVAAKAGTASLRSQSFLSYLRLKNNVFPLCDTSIQSPGLALDRVDTLGRCAPAAILR